MFLFIFFAELSIGKDFRTFLFFFFTPPGHFIIFLHEQAADGTQTTMSGKKLKNWDIDSGSNFVMLRDQAFTLRSGALHLKMI